MWTSGSVAARPDGEPASRGAPVPSDHGGRGATSIARGGAAGYPARRQVSFPFDADQPPRRRGRPTGLAFAARRRRHPTNRMPVMPQHDERCRCVGLELDPPTPWRGDDKPRPMPRRRSRSRSRRRRHAHRSPRRTIRFDRIPVRYTDHNSDRFEGSPARPMAADGRLNPPMRSPPCPPAQAGPGRDSSLRDPAAASGGRARRGAHR